MMRPLLITLVAVFTAFALHAGQQEIKLNGVKPGSAKLTSPIDKSKKGELTIASFNLRNAAVMDRSYEDLLEIVDLINEADIVVFQEFGLTGLDKNPDYSDSEKIQISQFTHVLNRLLGNEWKVITADTPTGSAQSKVEIPALAFRTQANGFTIDAKFAKYIDIAKNDARDMGVFEVTLKNGSKSETLLIGSVHLDTEDSEKNFRSKQMIAATKWLEAEAKSGRSAIVTGDFNWGYKTGSKEYLGEKYVSGLHQKGTVFLLFHGLLDPKKPYNSKYRTNLSQVGTGRFYDQFITTPNLARKLANRGSLMEDCGILAFDLRTSGRFRTQQKKLYAKRREDANDDKKKMLKLLDKTFKKMKLEAGEEAGAKKLSEALKVALSDYYKEVKEDAKNVYSVGDATRKVSDHRIIWMQLHLMNE